MNHVLTNTENLKYAYLLTPEEVTSINVEEEFEEFYPSHHPLAKRFHLGRRDRDYSLGITAQSKNLPGRIGLFYPIDNPVIHEPSLTASYLTHYILSKSGDSILGKVEFSRARRGEYVGTLNDGTEVFSTGGQTSWLTAEHLEEMEDYDYFASFYLYPLQMMYLPQVIAHQANK